MPGVGLGVLIFNDNDEVLLLLRNSNPKKALSDMRLEGMWTLPSGKVLYGEALDSAAIRKVKEETNLVIDGVEFISIADDINEFAHFVTIGFLAKKASGKIQLKDSEEHIEYKYFNLNDLPRNLCEPSKKIIDNYIEHKMYK